MLSRSILVDGTIPRHPGDAIMNSTIPNLKSELKSYFTANSNVEGVMYFAFSSSDERSRAGLLHRSLILYMINSNN